MKKLLVFCAAAVMGLSVLSCSKDDIPGTYSGSVISSYQLFHISGGETYAKDVFTPTYDARGRVVKTVYEMYNLSEGNGELRRVEIRDYDYEASTADITYCWEILDPGKLVVNGPDKATLELGDGLKLLKAKESAYTVECTYDGDYLASYTATYEDNDPIVKRYTWSGGDLVSMIEEEIIPELGTYHIQTTYGKEANPFVNTIDPLLCIYSSMLPDYAGANLVGKNSAHLPVSYQEDFYGDITFSYTYTKDDKGRIVRVDIKGDDPEGAYDRALVINYSSL